MELYEAMSNLRAVRRLKPDPIPDDVMERLLQAACWAPTGGNTQPWKVIVVTDPERKARLAEIYDAEWQPYVVEFLDRVSALPEEQFEQWKRVADSGNHLAAHLAEAPAILVFTGDPRLMAVTDAGLDRVSWVGGGSIYPAVQNLMLACVAEGVGCTITTLHCHREDEVKAVLDIPDEIGTAAMVPIGYPVLRGHGPISRRPPTKMAFRDTYGNRWPGVT